MHVVYGLVGLKTHAKCRSWCATSEDGLRRYCHIGTGNYNSQTARLYEDIGLLTVRPGDRRRRHPAVQLPHRLRPGRRNYEAAGRAPSDLRNQLADLIDHEASCGADGRHLSCQAQQPGRPGLIDALYRASQAGVPIDLLIRGICCLRPVWPGLSRTIRVRSIVGRYLEHSRIYRFAHGAGRRQPGRT